MAVISHGLWDWPKCQGQEPGGGLPLGPIYGFPFQVIRSSTLDPEEWEYEDRNRMYPPIHANPFLSTPSHQQG